MGIVFFGNEKLATGVTTKSSAMQALISNGYAPIVMEKSVGTVDMKRQLKSLKPDIGVLVAYGAIIPEDIINLFRYGIINIHPSLLPKKRGSSPIEATILGGDEETGVSIMQLGVEMDKGPVLARRSIDLRGNETKQVLADTLLDLGSKLLIKCLKDILAGNTAPEPQSDSEATYTQKIKKSDGIIDWSKSAVRIEREVRAYAGWPKSRTKLKDLECLITEVEVSNGSDTPGKFIAHDSTFEIFCGEGSLLIKRLQPAGKKEMSTEEFLRGYSKKLI